MRVVGLSLIAVGMLIPSVDWLIDIYPYMYNIILAPRAVLLKSLHTQVCLVSSVSDTMHKHGRVQGLFMDLRLREGEGQQSKTIFFTFS